MRCPACGESDEVILEKSFGYTDYGEGIYLCERCNLRFQVEIFELESEVSEQDSDAAQIEMRIYPDK